MASPDDLQGDPRRRPGATIRGFHYQFWRTVEAWIDLEPEEVLFVEGAEDFDRIRDGEATVVQVKDNRASGPLTLGGEKALGALANFWNLLGDNRGRRVSFKFITTAEAGFENDGFHDRKGVEIWNLCGRSPLESCLDDVAGIREFLLKKKLLDAHLLEFLKGGTPDAIRQELIQPFEWLYDQPALDDLHEMLVNRLLRMGNAQGLTLRDAQRLANDLYMRVVDEAIKRVPRPLRFADFMELRDRAANIEIPRSALLSQQIANTNAFDQVIAGGLRDRQGQLPALAEAGDIFTAPIPRDTVWRRPVLLDRVRAGLTAGIVGVNGGAGMGKTTLVRQAVEGRSPLLWAALRDRTVRDVADIIPGLIQRVASGPAEPTVVLDDLNPEGDPRGLEEHLGRVSIAVRAQRGALAVISYRALGPRLASVLALSPSCQVTVPAFEEGEIAQYLVAEGCPEERARSLARIVWLHTRGHAQLVAARINGLKAAAFPESSAEEILGQPREIEDARTEALAVIRSVLPEGARSLLYRMSLAIPPLKRSHALRIGEAEPPVPRTGEMFECLVGPWLEQPLPDRYRVSALASRSGQDLLPPDEAKRVHAHIARALLAERTVSASEFSGAIAHALFGDAEPQLATAVRVFLIAPRGLKEKLAEDLRWVAAVGIEPSTQLHLDNRFVRQVFRLFQWEVAGLAAPKQLGALAAAMEIEFAGAVDEPGEASLRILYLSKQLLEMNHPVSPDRIVHHTLEVWRLTEQANSQGLDIGRVLPPMYPGLDRSMFGDFFAAVLIPRIATVEDLKRLTLALEALPSDDRQRLLDGFKTDDGELRLLFSGPGISMKRGSDGAAEGYADALEQALSAGRRWQHRSWMQASARALSTILDEMLDRPEEARRVVITTAQEVGASNSLDDQLAIIAFNRNEYPAALETWQRILPSWEADRLFHDMQPAFSTRCAAISAANLGQWDIAARLFGEAIDRSAGMGTRPWRVGLLGDKGYVLWQSGNRGAAVTALNEAVEALAGMPNRPESFAEYAVQKLVGHTLAWLVDPDGHAMPIPGMCSNLSPSERIKELPPAPTSHMWFIMYELARQAGDDVVATAALNKFRAAPFAALRAIASRAELERRLTSHTLEGIVQLATATAIEMAKSAARKDVPTQEPDPPGLTAQITDGLIARYVRPALWSGIMVAKVLGRNIEELVTAWRGETDGAQPTVLHELDECTRQAGMEGGELTAILRNKAELGERRILSAVLILGREDVSPRDALYAQAMLTDASKDYELLRDTAGGSFSDLTRIEWRRLCDKPFILRSPRLHVDVIRQACELPGNGWPVAARIMLSALPATDLTIPGAIRERLEELARSTGPG